MAYKAVSRNTGAIRFFIDEIASGNARDVNGRIAIFKPNNSYLLDVNTGEIYDATPLLDVIPATSAYSAARVLKTSYTGNAFEVRRESDNAVLDIPYVDSRLDRATLNTFCSGTNGFVTALYDHMGVNDATQIVSTLQPKIYDSSTGINLVNGEPAILFDNTDDYLDCGAILMTPTGAQSFYIVYNNTNIPTGGKSMFGQYDSASAGRTKVDLNATYDATYFSQGTESILLNKGAADTDQHIIGVTQTSSNQASVCLDDVACTSDTGTAVSRYQRNTCIGGGPGSAENTIDGSVSEVIFYNTGKASVNDYIMTNINVFYESY